MSETGDTQRAVSRRSVAKAAAWSVPAIAIAAAVPAHAASNAAVASVVGICVGRSRTASFTIGVAHIPLGQQISIVLTMTGGSFVATPDFTHSGTGTAVDPYIVNGNDGPFQGLIGVTFTLPQSGLGTVTATVSGVSPFMLTGVTSATVTKRRDGNSSNYPCV